MGRRRIDWIQLAFLILSILGMALHGEHRLTQLETQLQGITAQLQSVQQRLDQLDAARR
jgi:hypothetical protein